MYATELTMSLTEAAEIFPAAKALANGLSPALAQKIQIQLTHAVPFPKVKQGSAFHAWTLMFDGTGKPANWSTVCRTVPTGGIGSVAVPGIAIRG